MTAPVEVTAGDSRTTPVDAPESRRASRPRWLAPAGVGASVGVALAYVAWQDPNGDGAYPLCPTFALFGIDCPGCGGLRATHALTHGDVVAALDHNVIITVLWPVAVVVWALWLLRTLGIRTPDLPRATTRWWWAIAPVLVAFTIARNLPYGGVFEYLAATA